MADPIQAARPVGRPRIHEADPEYYTAESIAARRAYQAQYKDQNKDAIKLYYKTWREAHRDQTRAYNRAWVQRKKQGLQGPAPPGLPPAANAPQGLQGPAPPGLPLEEPAVYVFPPGPLFAEVLAPLV